MPVTHNARTSCTHLGPSRTAHARLVCLRGPEAGAATTTDVAVLFEQRSEIAGQRGHRMSRASAALPKRDAVSAPRRLSLAQARVSPGSGNEPGMWRGHTPRRRCKVRLRAKAPGSGNEN